MTEKVDESSLMRSGPCCAGLLVCTGFVNSNGRAITQNNVATIAILAVVIVPHLSQSVRSHKSKNVQTVHRKTYMHLSSCKISSSFHM